MTLVELLIVLLIIGLLAVAASPFTSGWVKDAKLAEGASALEEAIGRAKSVAMRNQAKVTDNTPASRLCFTDSTVKLVALTSADAPTTPLTCDKTKVWEASLSNVVSVKVADVDWSCTCFSNRGIPTKAGDCGGCSDNLTFQFFHTGVEREKHSFY